MNIRKINKKEIVLDLSCDELLVLCNSLNEVCNGIKVVSFQNRIGINREKTGQIHKDINRIYGMQE
jgi:hypothetical protein